MYESCCGLKNHDQFEIKEISNPMKFESVFQPESKFSLGNTKNKIRNRIKNSEKECNILQSFPNAALLNINISKSVEPAEKSIQHPKTDSIYQEIMDNKFDISNKGILDFNNRQMKETVNREKKNTNLTYITSKILVTKVRYGDNQVYDKTICSLNDYYGKYLKIFYLSVRSSIENPHKDLTDSLSSLPYLTPFLNEIYQFLTNVTAWMRKSKKNVILLKCKEKSYHLLEAVVRFIIISDEINGRLLNPEEIILSHHEKTALLCYEKLHLEKFLNPSLRRYITTASNIFFGHIPYQSNQKQLHFLIIKNMYATDKKTNMKYGNSPRTSDGKLCDTKLQSVIISIYQNLHLIYTSYAIRLSEEKETDKIIYVVDPILPINGDILILANATNKLGIQKIYFRIQFHTCWLCGDTISLKNSELDLSKNYFTELVGSVDLHFKAQRVLIKEHENMLLSEKYFISNEMMSFQEIFSQLKLLEYSKKKNYLSYKAGPLDGSLYASITKSMKTYCDNDFSNVVEHNPVVSKGFQEPSSILNKFHNVELEISNASLLLSNTEKSNKLVFTDTANTNKLNQKTTLPTEIDIGRNKDLPIKELSKLRLSNINQKNEFLELSCEGQICEDNKLDVIHKMDFTYDNINLKKMVSNSLEKFSSTISKHHFSDQLFESKYESVLYDNFIHEQSNVISHVSTTQHLWYKSNFTRQHAILYLLNKAIGNFVIRPSTSLWKSLSIALKCNTSVLKQIDINEDTTNCIRHFIIDINTEGYRIRGFNNEMYYKTLCTLVQDHVENIIGLPHRLILPEESNEFNEFSCSNNFLCQDKYMPTSTRNDFSVLYLGSFMLQNIFDNSAISLSIDKLQEKMANHSNRHNDFSLTKMSMKLGTDRIIFTDLKRKMFFRKYCKFHEITCCDTDPKRRVWRNLQCVQKDSTDIKGQHSSIFGIVSCLPDNRGFLNQTCCQLFCTLDCNSDEFCTALKHSVNLLLK